MLDYTKAAFKKMVDDLKTADLTRNILTQIIYLVYLCYTLIVGSGIFWVNVVLTAIATVYFVFFIIVTAYIRRDDENKKAYKSVKKVGTEIFKWCKIIMKLFTVGVAIYGINQTVQNATPFSVIMTALMLVGVVLQIVFDLVIKVVTSRFTLLMDGLEADVNAIMAPVRATKNFFKRITGGEVEAPKELTKNQIYLKAQVDKMKAKKLADKEEKRRKKLEEKANAKAAREKLREEKREKKLNNDIFDK